MLRHPLIIDRRDHRARIWPLPPCPHCGRRMEWARGWAYCLRCDRRAYQRHVQRRRDE